MKESFRVFGYPGHLQRESFSPSCSYDWSTPGDLRKVSTLCRDKTGTNAYVIVVIERNTMKEIYDEFWGQVSDGIFEHSDTGRIQILKDNGKWEDLGHHY